MTLSLPTIKRVLALLSGAVVTLAVAFYWHQNFRSGVGGSISIVKVLWLASTIFWWFALPPLMLFDRRLSRQVHGALLLFTANMALRGAVELYMIYVAFNWHCYYGIAHDLATIGLLLVSSQRLKHEDRLDRTMRAHLKFLAAMFAFETYFAWSFHRQIRLQNPDLYFVPENWAKYGSILAPTAAAVLMVAVYVGPFVRGWLAGAVNADRTESLEGLPVRQTS